MTDEEREAAKAAIIAELETGRGLASICRDQGMPSARSVYNWMAEDASFGSEITRAREEGFIYRAEQAVIEAKSAEDAAKGRLALDAERWYLGKLSNALSDNKAQKHEVTHDLSDKAKAWLGLS
jgi:hypothetical protein